MLAAVIVSLTATSVPLSFSVSPLARFRALIVIEARLSLLGSVNWKSDAAKVLAVSCSVVTLLACATGGWLVSEIATLSIPIPSSLPVLLASVQRR